ncbi:HGxxPAAW family protein [Streptomyces polygonati]|uniref:HGxxPAAW family protein n=1 Tax=Streptomyces polygonati TaxID=1617087 RepID=A0ABV8HEU7_9ACTN
MAATHDHGHTPAAWTGVIISFIGFCVGGGFVVAAEPAGFWASIGLILLGPIVGGVMKLMGLGAKEPGYVESARAEATKAEQEEPRSPANA